MSEEVGQKGSLHSRPPLEPKGVLKGLRNSGKEIIHIKNENIMLKPNQPLLFFLQRIRDEAHRFAINSHRSKRGKESMQSVIEKIPGIGPKRKKILKQHFGSIGNIKKATIEELSEVKEIPKLLVVEIYNFFHS